MNVKPLAMLALAGFAACSDDPVYRTEVLQGTPSDEADASLDGAVSARSPDAGQNDTGSPSMIAPSGAIAGEILAQPGQQTVVLNGSMDVVYRVDTSPDEHIGFELDFAPADLAVTMQASRWTGTAPVGIGLTDAGGGLRVLAVRDANVPRTYWVRIHAAKAATTASLTLTRTKFVEGIHCKEDCAKLLQLPLPNDPLVDGYDVEGAVLRYQFGRRDLVMFFRDVASKLRSYSYDSVKPNDFSQWNGETPGTDVGAPRHVSHQRGKDVDVSLYGLDKLSKWRSYCTVQTTSNGRECKTGTAMNFDGYTNAHFFGLFYASDRVTYMFLDRELLALVAKEAPKALSDGLVQTAYSKYYSDGKHLEHWPNHDNHVHVRVSEESSTGDGLPKATWAEPDPLEAP